MPDTMIGKEELILPLKLIVDVDIEWQPALLGRDDFTTLCVIGTSPRATEGAVVTYNTPEAVSEDYGFEASEYAIAKDYFAQVPSPDKLIIADATKLVTDPDTATTDELMTALTSATVGFYGFCMAEEPTASNVIELAKWADAHNRMFMAVMTDAEASIAAGEQLNDLSLKHHLITHHDRYTAVGGFAGMALDQQYDKRDGIKTLHMKSVTGVLPTNVSQNLATRLNKANINYYAKYGNPDNALPIYTNGYTGSGYFFDFIAGVDWLRNVIETNVFNGQRLRRSTPQTPKGMAMIKADIIKGIEEAIAAGLVAGGRWNGAGVGEIDTYDYLEEGYYIYHEPIMNQPQVLRQQRQSPPITVLIKGAGAIHGVDITLIPEA